LLIHQEQEFERLRSKNRREMLHKKIKVNLIQKSKSLQMLPKNEKDPFLSPSTSKFTYS
jgi:hypothetical protein